MKTALIVVDVQRDFLPTGLPPGSLPVPDGDRVISPLCKLMPHVDLIVFTQDWHPANHYSFSDDPKFSDGSWPPHCVQKTRGAEIDTRLLAHAIATPTFFVEKGTDASAEAYSGFAGRVHKSVIGTLRENSIDRQYEDLSLVDALRKRKIEKVIVGGLALDYCVLETAIDARWLGFDTTVDLSLTRPVAKHSGEDAIAALDVEGIQVLDTSILGSGSRG